MAFDVSSLFLGVDSSQVRAGAADLQNFQRAATQAGQGADRFAGDLTKLAQVAASFVTFDLARRMLEAGEAFTLAQYRIERLTRATGDGRAIFEQLYQAAQRVGAPVQNMVEVFGRMSLVKETLGLTNREIAQVTENVGKLAVVSGSSTAAAQTALVQLGQIFSTGKAQGDELRSIMESMPDLINEVAKGLNKSTGELLAMARQGKLTGEDIARSLLQSTQRINDEFAKAPRQMQQGWQAVQNEFSRYVSKLDESLGITKGIISDFDAIRDIIEELSRIPVPEWMRRGGAGDMLRNTAREFRTLRQAFTDAPATPEEAQQRIAEQQARIANLQGAGARTTRLPGGGRVVDLNTQEIDEARGEIERLTNAFFAMQNVTQDYPAAADAFNEAQAKVAAQADKAASALSRAESAVAKDIAQMDRRVAQAERLAAIAGRGGGAARLDALALNMVEQEIDPTATGVERSTAMQRMLPGARRIVGAQAEASRREAIAEARLQAEAEERLARAARVSSAAMEEAANANRVAAFEHEHGAGTGKELAAALDRVTQAQRDQRLADRTRELEDEAAIAERLSAAVDAGSISFLNAQKEARALAEAQRLAAETGISFAEAYERIIASLNTQEVAQRKVALLGDVEDSRRAAQFAREQLNTVSLLPAARDKHLAIVQKTLELEKQFGPGYEAQKQAILANVAAIADFNEQARLQLEDIEAWRAPFQNLVTDLDDIFTDFFEDSFRKGELSWRSMLNNLKDMSAKFAAEILRLFIIRPMLAPMAGALGVPGYGTGGMGGMGAMGGLPISPFGAGGGQPWINPDTGLPMGGGGGFWGGITNQFTNPAGFSALGMLGGGFLGYGTSSLTAGLGGRTGPAGNILGTIGGIAGSYFGPLGSMAGGLIGGAIGGLFGPKKSVGPNAGANLMLGAGGGIGLGGAGADNRGNVAEAMSFAQQAGDVFRSLRDFGINITRDVQTQFGSFKGELFSSVGGGRERSVYRGADSEQAILAVVRALTEQGALAGSGTSGQILSRGNFQNLQQLTEALSFGKLYDELVKGEQAATGLTKQVQDLNKTFDDARAKADQYGLSVGQIEEARQRALARMRDDFNKSVQQQILAMTDPVRAALMQWEEDRKQAERDWMAIGGTLADLSEVYRLFELKRAAIVEQSNQAILVSMQQTKDALAALLSQITGGPLSPLSPGEQYARAASAFAAAEQQGRTKGTVPADFAQVTQQFLEASRIMFASTERYAEDYKKATNLLQDLLGLPRAAMGGYSAGGMTVVGERGPEIVKLPQGARVFGNREPPTPANDFGGDIVASIMNVGRSTSEVVGELRTVNANLQVLIRKFDLFLAGRAAPSRVSVAA